MGAVALHELSLSPSYITFFPSSFSSLIFSIPGGPPNLKFIFSFTQKGFPLSLLDSSSYQNISSQAVNSSLIETLVHTCVCAKSLQLPLTPCDPVDNSLPGSSIHGTLQAGTLERVAMPYFRVALPIPGWC